MLEKLILKNLLYNEEYVKKVHGFINPLYFKNKIERVIFEEIDQFINMYDARPSKEGLIICIDKRKDISSEYNDIIETLNNIEKDKNKHDELPFLVAETEKWISDRAIYNALMDSISIYEDTKKEKGSIPDILSKALSVTIDPSVGHNYTEDLEERWNKYHEKHDKISFGIPILDDITNGGINKKTLNVIMASTGVGKTLFMCSWAANLLNLGKNVLYITLEMAEEEIAKRIDANILDIEMDKLNILSKEKFFTKFEELKKKCSIGKLFVKEYPTAAANVNHFKHCLFELKIKQHFVPDVIFIDYINISASTRIKVSSDSYHYIKCIAEEFRGFGVEQNIPIVSATQTNRGGFNNPDIDLSDTSESFGLPMTVDLQLGIMQPEEMVGMNQIIIKQMKNRYKDKDWKPKFFLGIDKPKMRVYQLDTTQEIKSLENYNQLLEEKSENNVTDSFFKNGGSKKSGKKFDKFKF